MMVVFNVVVSGCFCGDNNHLAISGDYFVV